MNRLADYLHAAERDNTRRSYASAIRHFEVEWKGLLPATGDAIAQYLSDHAETLSMNTLRHRLAALSRWHSDQGFADPTKQPLVRQVLKGIRALHPAIEKRARPIQLDVLQQVCDWLDRGIELARQQQDQVRLLRLTRDRALLLLGFWRGFRADELVHLQVEHLDLIPGEGLTCYLPRSKGDRQLKGRRFSCPALSRLCPVAAMDAWLSLTVLAAGPVFRKIDRWGYLRDTRMQPNSVISLLRRLFTAAGIDTPEEYSSHSLRRGFAEWSRINGWDFKELMEYVGWRDLKSAMRYLESSPDQLRHRFEQGLPPLRVSGSTSLPTALFAPTLPGAAPMLGATLLDAVPVRTVVVLTVGLTGFSRKVRSVAAIRRRLERRCLERYALQRLDMHGTQFELTLPHPSGESLDIAIHELFDELHRFANDHHCYLEARCRDPLTGRQWG